MTLKLPWKDVLGARDKMMKKDVLRFIEEKTRAKRCRYHSKNDVNIVNSIEGI